ncbi:hypothetical protein [Arcobacter sp. LA11]|uniref:hypothetical protein n=1 Tax=Arcobacter sp. LA11 TaxID=1898176 RepID=UPI0009351394|nr:hypothetical protein [Arcobacter sp. LA11]
MIRSTTKHYIEFFDGNLPIILSAPHGGEEMPSEIKTRTSGVFDKDDFTLELTKDIIEEFYNKTGFTPYGIIATISRKKVDINREIYEAYEDEKASIPYNQFHHLIKSSKESIEKRFGKGLYIDIHGQSHPKGYLEFGYLLDNDILKLHETELKENQDKSSIRTLNNFSQEGFIDQLRGPHSLGSLMCNHGFDSIPSVKLPYASDGNYFEGAYDTIRYGSLNGGNISGIQIEFPYLGCRDTKENRKQCAKAFVDSILKFMIIHFQLDLKKITP